MSVQTTYPSDFTATFPGTPADGAREGHVMPMRNDESSDTIAFGAAVKFASTTDEYSAENLTAITGETIAGIVRHSHNYDPTQIGAADENGYPTVAAASDLNVMRAGRMKVICEDGCSVGNPLFVRAVATGSEIPGALRATADGSDTIDCTGVGMWLTSAAAGGLATLEFDFAAFVVTP